MLNTRSARMYEIVQRPRPPAWLSNGIILIVTLTVVSSEAGLMFTEWSISKSNQVLIGEQRWVAESIEHPQLSHSIYGIINRYDTDAFVRRKFTACWLPTQCWNQSPPLVPPPPAMHEYTQLYTRTSSRLIPNIVRQPLALLYYVYNRRMWYTYGIHLSVYATIYCCCIPGILCDHTVCIPGMCDSVTWFYVGHDTLQVDNYWSTRALHHLLRISTR